MNGSPRKLKNKVQKKNSNELSMSFSQPSEDKKQTLSKIVEESKLNPLMNKFEESLDDR